MRPKAAKTALNKAKRLQFHFKDDPKKLEPELAVSSEQCGVYGALSFKLSKY